MLKGDSTNVQQQKRWPKHGTQRAQVLFEPRHLDPDYESEDSEDGMPGIETSKTAVS